MVERSWDHNQTLHQSGGRICATLEILGFLNIGSRRSMWEMVMKLCSSMILGSVNLIWSLNLIDFSESHIVRTALLLI